MFRLLLYLLLNRADSYLKKLTREWGDSDSDCLLCDIYSIVGRCSGCCCTCCSTGLTPTSRSWQRMKRLRSSPTTIFSPTQVNKMSGGLACVPDPSVPFRVHCKSRSSIKRHGSGFRWSWWRIPAKNMQGKIILDFCILFNISSYLQASVLFKRKKGTM